MPELTDDGRAALHTISDALNTLEEDAFGRWDAMNDVATAVGLDWQTATRDGILGRIKSALVRAEAAEQRVAELETLMALGITVPPPDDGQRVEAAGQWQPVTEEWPPHHARVVIGQMGGNWAAFARRVRNDDGDDEWQLADGDGTLDFESAAVALALPPLPPPPDAAEAEVTK